MKPLTKEQLKIIFGALNSDPGYGAQANGFQPNVSAGASGMGLGQDSLSNSVGGGLLAGVGSLLGPMGTIGGAALGGMLAGGAFNSSNNATSSANSGS